MRIVCYNFLGQVSSSRILPATFCSASHILPPNSPWHARSHLLMLRPSKRKFLFNSMRLRLLPDCGEKSCVRPNKYSDGRTRLQSRPSGVLTCWFAYHRI